ncbi:MAG: hypothetical protein E6G22_04440 [Actinobacteria bacterium]|nr:MAG: hypothetical protein E6G22_04440 [Actinomycetota bacterium]
MGSMVSGEVLARPVRLHGIDLGRAVELVVDLDVRRVLGFEVRCGGTRTASCRSRQRTSATARSRSAPR